MSWEAYLESLTVKADASAIMSIRGDRYAAKGDWKATHAEEVYISKIFEKPTSYAGKDLTYGGKKFIICRCEDQFVMAHATQENQSNALLVDTVLVEKHLLQTLVKQ